MYRSYRTSPSIFIVALALLVSTVARAEAPPFPMNVRINPLSILLGIINTDYDIRVSEHITFGPSIGFATRSSSTVTTTGFDVGVRANFYLTGKAISDSWYASPAAGVIFLTSKSGGSSASTTALNAGVTFGYHWVWDSGFNLTLGLGVAYYAVDKNQRATDGSVIVLPAYSGTLPRLDFTLGFAF